MTVTPAKLDANRRNARKSTGPRTAEGKKRSSRNATTHGIFCQQLLLSGESTKDFILFRNGFLGDWNPHGATELMLVDRIVSAAWKLRRLNRVETMINEMYIENLRLFTSDPECDLPDDVRERLSEAPISGDEGQAAMYLDRDSRVFERTMRQAKQLELSMHRALREREKVQKRTQSHGLSREMQPMFGPEFVGDEAMESEDADDRDEPKKCDEDREEISGVGVPPARPAAQPHSDEDSLKRLRVGEAPTPQDEGEMPSTLLNTPRFDTSSDRIDRRSGATVTSVNQTG